MIIKATDKDLNDLAKLACALWPDSEPYELKAEFAALLDGDDAAFFLYKKETEYIGFAYCGLRSDYVEGAESSPIGYLEGIYISPVYRRKTFASQLLNACEEWAKTRGCAEFASDCELDNKESFDFHTNAGFREANRIICFTKKLI